MPATDLEIARRASAGDEEAFEALVLRHQDRVYRLALRLTGSPEEAEDVTQEAFLKAYRALGEFDGRSAFYTWLFRIAVNSALSRLRTLGRRRAREATAALGDPAPRMDAAGEPPSRSAGPEEAVLASDVAARVRRAVDELAPEDRAVVVLREIEGLSYDEIALAMGATRAAVKSRLHRSRQELARKLRDLVQ